jgi:hypothetical protein
LDKFPLANGEPLLVDPTVEDPWQFLDFDPATGNLVPRFDLRASAWSPKGTSTVEVLELDRREALAAGYQATHSRLVKAVEQALHHPPPDGARLAGALRSADDHGLLGWCFRGTGQNTPPFSILRQQYPSVWDTCMADPA